MTRPSTQALALLLGLVSSFAQAESDEKPLPPSAMFHGAAGLPLPAVELPAYVPAPQGQVTFWADFAHASEDKVPLYLVNHTKTPRSFSSQDNGIYIKLEFKNPAGKWTRAQAHLSSWCGNSYYPIELPPGQFLVLHGYRPKEGNAQTVRYASPINTELVSNEGTGLISDTDVKHASKDAITESLIPRVIRLSLEPRDPREHPVPERIRDWLGVATSIHSLKLMERNEVALDWIRDLKQTLDSLPASTEVAEAQSAAEEILTYTWPSELKPDALFNRCIEALEIAESGPPRAGTLESQPGLVWGLLAAMFGEYAPPQSRAQALKYDLTKLKPVMMAAARQVINDPKGNGFPAASVLDCAAIADQVIPASQYEEWLLHPQPALQEIAARGLARRKQWESLSGLGMKLSPQGQLMVLEALAFEGHGKFRGQEFIREPELPGEKGFWIHCMKMQPLGAVDTLWTNDRGEPKRSLSKVLHDPLRDYLKQEAERAVKISTYYDLGPHGPKLYLAVQMLGSWKLKEDIPIFKLLLKHQGYYGYNGCAIQSAARKALELQGEILPAP